MMRPLPALRRLGKDEFLHHAPCPRCGSRDNLGVYGDGHKWCFGCQYYIKGDTGASVEEMKARLVPSTQQEENTPNASDSSLSLPADYTRSLEPIGAQWLLKYGISKGERIKNHIGWSQRYESLVFPVYDSHDNLLLVQRRFFGAGKWPKYHTKGRPESVLHILGDGDLDTGVLTEDLLSAIKVGRQYNATPLWGSNLSVDKVRRLSHRFSKLIIWLDRDKAKDSVKYKWRAMPFFEKVHIIVSELDPKEYNDDTIASLVEPNL